VTPSARRLLDILGTQGVGRRHPVATKALAAELGLPRRAIGAVVAEAIEAGALIGSTCDASRPGYFIVRDLDDLEEGTRHIRARALSSLRRISVLKHSAERAFGPDAVPLFDLEVDGAASITSA
jgi:hypothetical protein